MTETLRSANGNAAETAQSLGVREDQVHAALRYYNEFSDEVDELIALNHEEADRAQRLWEQQAPRP